MARGKKTSSEDKAKVIIAKIQNPDLSLRDLEEKTGVKRDTSKRILDEDLPEIATSSDKTRELINVNISIITNGKKIIEKIVKDVAEKPEEAGVKINGMNDVKSLSSVLEDAFKQNQLLEGKPTEIKDLKFKDLEGKPVSELLTIINNLTRE